MMMVVDEWWWSKNLMVGADDGGRDGEEKEYEGGEDNDKDIAIWDGDDDNGGDEIWDYDGDDNGVVGGLLWTKRRVVVLAKCFEQQRRGEKRWRRWRWWWVGEARSCG